jgi:ADP-glucose pyrophosphorylase
MLKCIPTYSKSVWRRSTLSRLTKLLKVIICYPKRFFSNVSLLAVIVESKLSKPVSVGSSANIRYSTIGCYTYVGKRTNIAYAEVGKFCSIANDVSIGGGSHPIDWVSTSPCVRIVVVGSSVKYS